MANNRRFGQKIGKHHRSGDMAATKLDAYPHIGIVKNNFDPIKAGRLQVWIPEFGTREEDAKSWRTVSYASPFMGTTSLQQSDSYSRTNAYNNAPHTYGMWMVPPDIGVQVICIFVEGDPNQGYWLACVNSNLSRHMLPALGSSDNLDLENLVDKSITPKELPSKTGRITTAPRAPVTEFNELSDKTKHNLNTAKPIHEPQYNILKTQGLDRDVIRGPISSSSQRESPSMVFGISTPGRPLNDPANDLEAYVEKINNPDKIRKSDYIHKTRKGGHTFVMDDGAVTGADELIRLRTANGHQITMHDTAESFYLSHSNGKSWIELTKDGRVQIYSSEGIDLRTEGDFNVDANRNIVLNARGNILMHSKGPFKVNTNSNLEMRSIGEFKIQSTQEDLKVKAGEDFVVDAADTVSIRGGVNLVMASTLTRTDSTDVSSAPVQSVSGVATIPMNRYTDPALIDGYWIANQKELSSIALFAPPTHEPYNRSQDPANNLIARNVREAADANASTGAEERSSVEVVDANAPAEPGSFNNNSGNGFDSTQTLEGKNIKNAATETDLANQPTVDPIQVGEFEMSSDETTAYMAQMGKSESGGDYTAVNDLGYVGKYQMGAPALIDQGYVKAGTTNSGLDDPANWTGKSGITSKTAFLNSPDVQEQAMYSYTKQNYSYLVSAGGITSEQSQSEKVGMLSAAHLLGAGGATTWRKTGSGADAYGTTGEDYFKRGRYSQEILAPKVIQV